MAKLKAPFLSLEAHKTIGDALTVQRRAGVSFIRKKPVPAYRYSLPQAYQRWLYEDYAYLWRQQSAATQATWRTGGVRFHLTGFQYWMKYQLTNLPDIKAWYRLDARDRVIAHDSSRNGNDATVFGPSPATGLIQDCLSSDGLNDYCRAPTSTSLAISSPMSIELFLNITDITKNQAFVNYALIAWTSMYGLSWTPPNSLLLFYYDGAAWQWNIVAWAPSQDTWYHVVAQLTGTWVEYYINGAFPARVAQVNAPGAHPGAVLTLFNDVNLIGPSQCLIDNLIIRDRALDATEILRHSLRRYPA